MSNRSYTFLYIIYLSYSSFANSWFSIRKLKDAQHLNR